MQAVILKLLEWLEKNLSNVLLAFNLGHKIGKDKLDELKKSLLEEETKRMLLENEINNEKNNSNKSDADIVREAINSTRGKQASRKNRT